MTSFYIDSIYNFRKVPMGKKIDFFVKSYINAKDRTSLITLNFTRYKLKNLVKQYIQIHKDTDPEKAVVAFETDSVKKKNLDSVLEFTDGGSWLSDESINMLFKIFPEFVFRIFPGMSPELFPKLFQSCF